MTKGVEDGMGDDERIVKEAYPHAVEFAGIIYSHGRDEELKEGEFIQILGRNWADARAKLPAAVPEAKPEPPVPDTQSAEVIIACLTSYTAADWRRFIAWSPEHSMERLEDICDDMDEARGMNPLINALTDAVIEAHPPANPLSPQEERTWYFTAPVYGHPYFFLNYQESVMSWPYEIAIRNSVPNAEDVAKRLCLELSAPKVVDSKEEQITPESMLNYLSGIESLACSRYQHTGDNKYLSEALDARIAINSWQGKKLGSPAEPKVEEQDGEQERLDMKSITYVDASLPHQFEHDPLVARVEICMCGKDKWDPIHVSQHASIAIPNDGGPAVVTPDPRHESQKDAVRELVDRQAEDEGLWFKARTLPEAYLQQELRKLHAAIENKAKSVDSLSPSEPTE